MKTKHLIAGLSLAAFATAAQAEGNHDFGNLGLILGYFALTFLVIVGVWFYVLFLPRVGAGIKLLSVLALAGVDAVASIMVFQGSRGDNFLNPEWPFAYILAALPGIVLAVVATKHSNRQAGRLP